MSLKRLEKLRKEYMETPIPKELNDFVTSSINKGIMENRRRTIFRMKVISASTAASLVVFAAGINMSPVFADTVSQIPVLGKIVNVLTIKQYNLDEDNYNANIKVPSIVGLEDKELENSFNEKYLTENKKLYEDFISDIEQLKKEGGGHMGVDSGYIVKTDTEKILSVARYIVNTAASSSTTMKYDTIDKENELLITLPSLFKNEEYIDVISQEIKKQMLEQNKADENRCFWIEEIEDSDFAGLFEKISKEQNFYINADNKLVISFDKYEVAPGYMGILEFEIPTEIISNFLVSNEYVK